MYNSKRSRHHRNGQQCVNCGKFGHVFKTCTEPITSYGIIAMCRIPKQKYKRIPLISTSRYICDHHQQMYANANADNNITNNNKTETKSNDDNDDDNCSNNKEENELCFLMVQRRDTMGYIDFIRGKYSDETQMKVYISEMTCDERNKLISNSFDDIWNQMWVNHSCKMFVSEKGEAAKKFASVNLKKVFEEVPCNFCEPEWCIPKGRKNVMEDDVHCALREFKEETGYSDMIHFIDHKVWNEQFEGTNGVTYRHLYYCTYVPEWQARPEHSIELVRKAGEISNVTWMSLAECLERIRPYDHAKKQLLENVALYYSEYGKMPSSTTTTSLASSTPIETRRTSIPSK